MRRIPYNPGTRWRTRRGFTLIEVLVAVVILGIGILALVHCVGLNTAVNGASRNLARGALLAQEVREWSLKLPYLDPDPNTRSSAPGLDPNETAGVGSDVDDIDDLKGQSFSPPVDARGLPMTDCPAWTQKIDLSWRSESNIGTTVPDGASKVVHVGVEIQRGNETILATGWLVTGRDE